MRSSTLPLFFLLAAPLLSGLAAAAPPLGIIRIKPAAPQSLQAIGIEVLAPGCGVMASPSMAGNLITVQFIGSVHCSPPPAPTRHEVSIGSLPAGDYQVVLQGIDAPPLSFTVGAGEALTDRVVVQTGIWWDPRFPGTGLTIIDGFPERRVISFATHDAFRRPVTYTMVLERGQVGGTLYRAEGTAAAQSPPTPDVSTVPAGSASLLARDDGTLVFDYTVDSLPRHRLVLQRFPL